MSNVVEANAAGWEHIKELTARITELETANKGLQIALLDASEKEKELQLRNAMLVEQLNDAAESVQEWGNYADQYFQEKWDLAGDVQKYKDVANAIPAQSAAWLEEKHREWMNNLIPAVYMQSAHLDGFVHKACGSDSMLARCSYRQLHADYAPLYAIPKGD